MWHALGIRKMLMRRVELAQTTSISVAKDPKDTHLHGKDPKRFAPPWQRSKRYAPQWQKIQKIRTSMAKIQKIRTSIVTFLCSARLWHTNPLLMINDYDCGDHTG